MMEIWSVVVILAVLIVGAIWAVSLFEISLFKEPEWELVHEGPIITGSAAGGRYYVKFEDGTVIDWNGNWGAFRWEGAPKEFWIGGVYQAWRKKKSFSDYRYVKITFVSKPDDAITTEQWNLRGRERDMNGPHIPYGSTLGKEVWTKKYEGIIRDFELVDTPDDPYSDKHVFTLVNGDKMIIRGALYLRDIVPINHRIVIWTTPRHTSADHIVIDEPYAGNYTGETRWIIK